MELIHTKASLVFIREMKSGDYFYSSKPGRCFTFVARHGIKITTERYLCVNPTTLKAIRITKITKV